MGRKRERRIKSSQEEFVRKFWSELEKEMNYLFNYGLNNSCVYTGVVYTFSP